MRQDSGDAYSNRQQPYHNNTTKPLLLTSQKKGGASAAGSGRSRGGSGGESLRIFQGVKNLIKINSQIEERINSDDAYSRMRSNSNGVK